MIDSYDYYFNEQERKQNIVEAIADNYYMEMEKLLSTIAPKVKELKGDLEEQTSWEIANQVLDDAISITLKS